MIYGSPPFQHISGGPLSKMNTIADPNHRINYPSHAVSRPTPVMGSTAQPLEVPVPTEVIATMHGSLVYDKEKRLTIPQLLNMVPATNGESARGQAIRGGCRGKRFGERDNFGIAAVKAPPEEIRLDDTAAGRRRGRLAVHSQPACRGRRCGAVGHWSAELMGQAIVGREDTL